MTTTNLKKQQLLSLKAKIKGLAEGGIRCRKFIQASKGDERYRRWNEKRALGQEARYHLIAYGLLRGMAYDKIEPNSNKDMLASYNFDYNYLAQICQRHCHYGDRGMWSPANLQRLIKTGTMTVTVKLLKRVAL